MFFLLISYMHKEHHNLQVSRKLLSFYYFFGLYYELRTHIYAQTNKQRERIIIVWKKDTNLIMKERNIDLPNLSLIAISVSCIFPSKRECVPSMKKIFCPYVTRTSRPLWEAAIIIVSGYNSNFLKKCGANRVIKFK